MARKKNIAAGQNAVIYARYSSHNQREVSIEQQVRECMKHAAELGLHVVGTYEDRAISGKTDKRPNFQRMMRDAEKGKFQAVVAWKSNRIGRNMLQAMVNEAKLEDCGVKVFYAEEDFDDTAAGRFALRNMMNVNQFYSENMAEDITRGLYDNASKCMANGRQPLGYKRGEDGRVVLDEANAAVCGKYSPVWLLVTCSWTLREISMPMASRPAREPTGTKAASRVFARTSGTGASTYTGMSGWPMAFHA